MKNIEISSLTHPIVKHLLKLKTDREYRYQNKTLLVTGLKLIQEIISDIPFKVILLEKNFPIPSFVREDFKIYWVSRDILKKVSGLENPEPILAEVEFPPLTEKVASEFLLVLDGISDPGNMGTLIRSALALNWKSVFIAPNCTDPFNEKAVRAAKGATFRIPIKMGSWEDLKKILMEEKMACYLADMQGAPFSELQIKPGSALILCNESRGPSAEAQALAKPVSIPISSKMESLNVAAAGAILMYELRKAHGS